MNLFEWLYQSVATDPTQPISDTNPPLKVFTTPPDPADVGYDPYALVEEAPGNVSQAYYGNADTMSKLILVSLYQEPTAKGDTPSRIQLTNVFNAISNGAPHNVTEDLTPGQFVALHRQAEQAPTYNADTKGLMAAIRFRMIYQRA